MFKHTENDADKLVHDGAADLKFGQFWPSGQDLLGPKFDRSAKAKGNGSRHEEGFAQQGITDFGESGFSGEATGLILHRIKPCVEGS